MILMTDEEEINTEINLKDTEKVSFFTPEKTLLLIGIIIIIIVIGVFSIMKWHMVEQPFFGGLFNSSFWGQPLYVFFIPLVPLAYFLAWAYWGHLQWGMMSPFHGLWNAMNSRSEVVFKTDERLNFVLTSEAGACLVFEKDRYNSLVKHKYPFLTPISNWLRPVDQSVDFAKFLQGSWESKPMVNIGSIPGSILVDIKGWTGLISPERAAIAKECDLWNETNESDQVHSLSKAWRLMNEGKIPVPRGVDLYTTIKWIRIDNSYPRIRNSASWGGFVRQLAENIARGDYNKGMSMTTAGIVVFIACLAISAMMFIMKFMAHVPAK